MSALTSGTSIQYRKTGQGVIQSHACPPGRFCNGSGTTTAHRYWVLFRTGPYHGQDKLIWVRNDEAIVPEARP